MPYGMISSAFASEHLLKSSIACVMLGVSGSAVPYPFGILPITKGHAAIKGSLHPGLPSRAVLQVLTS